MQKENGSSTVIGFVLIFAILAVLAALYFAAVVPAEEKRAAEVSLIFAKEDMISFSLLLNELEASPHTPLSYLPVFSDSAAAELTSGGTLSIGNETRSLTKLVLSTGNSRIGLASGGVFRSDEGDAVWLLHPQISGFGDAVCCILPLYHGSISRGTSSGGIPLTAEYLGTVESVIQSDSPVLMRYVGDDAKLWYAFFYELSKTYPQAASPVLRGDGADVTLLPKEDMAITILCPEYQLS